MIFCKKEKIITIIIKSKNYDENVLQVPTTEYTEE